MIVVGTVMDQDDKTLLMGEMKGAIERIDGHLMDIAARVATMEKRLLMGGCLLGAVILGKPSLAEKMLSMFLGT